MSKLSSKLGRLSAALRGTSEPAEDMTEPRVERELPLERWEADERLSSLSSRVASGSARSALPEGLADDRSTRVSQLRAQMEGLRGKMRRERAKLPFKRVFPDEACAPDLAPASVAGQVPGERSETELGPLRTVLTRFEKDHRHGSIPVSSALQASAAELALLALDPSLAAIDFSRALYIDTETTGLAGGSGTLPFLIGMAWFEGAQLVVEQLLLERPGLETPMLARLAERLALSSVVVSYNGKSFDWPLLRTRFILQRIAAPKLSAHLDLLHCARRVYKRRLGSVRLVNLEEEILGFTRVDDIPGELIPQTYLGFVRGQVPGGALAPIVEHNRNDLVALAAMLGELTRRFRGEQPGQDARDQLGFAGVAARADDHGRAVCFAEAAAEADLRGELAYEAHYLAGEMHLRAGDLAAAERSFLLSVETSCAAPPRAAKAHLALSKLYEHRLKRYRQALSHARACEALEGSEASARRVARLLRRADACQDALLPLELP